MRLPRFITLLLLLTISLSGGVVAAPVNYESSNIAQSITPVNTSDCHATDTHCEHHNTSHHPSSSHHNSSIHSNVEQVHTACPHDGLQECCLMTPCSFSSAAFTHTSVKLPSFNFSHQRPLSGVSFYLSASPNNLYRPPIA
ncbi:hypothetical protein DFP78_104111 [Photobacterium lutimaris]|nr:hypothetical protein DFP78_104111 [Photobacterium lutimaris]